MKKLIVTLTAFLLMYSCKTTPEAKVEEQAIETTQDGKVLLRVKPKVGDMQNMLVTMETGGEGVSMNMNMELNIKVTDVTDNLYSYEFDFESIGIDADMMGQKMTYNSKEEPDNEMGKVMAKTMEPLLNGVAKMVMNEMGEVQRMDWGEMEKAFQGQAPDFGSMNLVLPKEAVGVGDSWEATRNVPQQANSKMNFKMTVNKITTNAVVVDVSGTLEGMAPGKITGSYEVDKNTGFTINGNMDVTMDVSGKEVVAKSRFKQL